MTIRNTAALAALALALAAPAGIAQAGHKGTSARLTAPIAGVHNNHWYDYRSDLEEAEIELRKDLDDAKTGQDRREAYQEYRRELADARSDYVKEARENGLIQGRVTVGDGR